MWHTITDYYEFGLDWSGILVKLRFAKSRGDAKQKIKEKAVRIFLEGEKDV